MGKVRSSQSLAIRLAAVGNSLQNSSLRCCSTHERYCYRNNSAAPPLNWCVQYILYICFISIIFSNKELKLKFHSHRPINNRLMSFWETVHHWVTNFYLMVSTGWPWFLDNDLHDRLTMQWPSRSAHYAMTFTIGSPCNDLHGRLTMQWPSRSAQYAMTFRADSPYMSVRADSPYMSVRADSPYMSVRADSPYMSVRADSPYMSVWADSPYMSVWADSPYMSVLADSPCEVPWHELCP